MDLNLNIRNLTTGGLGFFLFVKVKFFLEQASTNYYGPRLTIGLFLITLELRVVFTFAKGIKTSKKSTT